MLRSNENQAKKIAGLRYMTCSSMKSPLGQVKFVHLIKDAVLNLHVIMMKPEIKMIISAANLYWTVILKKKTGSITDRENCQKESEVTCTVIMISGLFNIQRLILQIFFTK